MAKKEKKESSGESVPTWMITFSDLMTLLLTFFVLLLSMASLQDVSRRKVALGSVSGRFGTGAPRLDDLTTDPQKRVVEPGPMNLEEGLEPIKKRVWEDPDSDLRFEYNRFIERISLDAALLFEPGSAVLSEKGRQMLAELQPVLLDSEYPLGLAGHSAGGIDEFGPDYLADPQGKVDFSWELSLARVMEVYRFFVDSGVPAEKLRVEAFGRFQPKAGSQGMDARNADRRVDITLDKRIQSWAPSLLSAVENLRPGEKPRSKDSVEIKDFIFRFDLPEGR